MEGYREFRDPQTGAEMPPDPGYHIDVAFPGLLGQLVEFLAGELSNVPGGFHPMEDGHVTYLLGRRAQLSERAYS
jgi:hypothetical protein